jgi:hypothetical protein
MPISFFFSRSLLAFLFHIPVLFLLYSYTFIFLHFISLLWSDCKIWSRAFGDTDFNANGKHEQNQHRNPVHRAHLTTASTESKKTFVTLCWLIRRFVTVQRHSFLLLCDFPTIRRYFTEFVFHENPPYSTSLSRVQTDGQNGRQTHKKWGEIHHVYTSERLPNTWGIIWSGKQ